MWSSTPGNLRKGANFPYLVGNTGYWWVQKKNPFDSDRITTLINATDIQWIKQAGFDHIRIPIDPEAVGYDPATNTINPLKLTSYNGTTAAANIASLKGVMQLAFNQNLAIVLGFQPEFVSQKHYDRMVGWDTDHAHPTGTGWQLFHYLPLPLYNNADELEATFKLGWKQDFCTFSASNPLGPNHRLAKFWDGFLSYFDSASAPPDKVYFGILDEPMSAFNMANTAQTEPDQGAWELWFKNRISEWRSVQLEALKVCLAKPVNWKFIATAAIGDPREFNTAQNWQNGVKVGTTEYRFNGNWPFDMPTFGNPYSPGAPDNIGASNMLDVIYSPNVYSPFYYTHYKPSQNSTGEYYEYNPDYKGISPPTPWDPMEFQLNTVQAWQIATQPIGSTMGPGGVIILWIAPMYITGFGAVKRNSAECLEPGTCMPHAPREAGYVLPGATGYNPAASGPMRLLDDRLMWHWDVRKKSEQNGWGWCVWEWQGSMGVSEGTRFQTYLSPGKTIHGRPLNITDPNHNGAYRAPMHEELRNALFVWPTRPRGF